MVGHVRIIVNSSLVPIQGEQRLGTLFVSQVAYITHPSWEKKGLGLMTDHRSPRMGILKNPTALPTPLQKSLVC